MSFKQTEITGKRRLPYGIARLEGKVLLEVMKKAGRDVDSFSRNLGLEPYEVYELSESSNHLPENIAIRLYSDYWPELDEILYQDRVHFYESLGARREPTEKIQTITNEDSVKDYDIALAIELGIRGKFNEVELSFRGERGDFSHSRYRDTEKLLEYRSVEGGKIKIVHHTFWRFGYSNNEKPLPFLDTVTKVYRSGRIIRQYDSRELPSNWLPLITPHLVELADTGADSEDLIASLDTLCLTLASEEERLLDDMSRIDEIKLVEQARSAMVLTGTVGHKRRSKKYT